MQDKIDIVTIGEALIELSADTKLSSADCMTKYYGGDALATAIAALRSGSNVGFITKVGNDSFKEFLLQSWQAEGLDISQIKLADEPNGLYFIARESLNEKEIVYYRRKIAPSKLSVDDISEDYIKNSKIVYSSGITQSLSLSAKEAVKKAFLLAKENSLYTAYDPNYYSQIMNSDDAKENFNDIISTTDILFMSTKHDTVNLLEVDSVENTIKKLWDGGVSVIVIKDSEKGGYYTGYNGNVLFTDFYTREVIDTTSSGDAFNGGFLHALTHGYTPFEAASYASVVAGLQAKGIGAIKSIPYKEEILAAYKGGQA